jgi:hypothetical protein
MIVRAVATPYLRITTISIEQSTLDLLCHDFKQATTYYSFFSK